MSLPYFNLYPTDFEADTAHLTLEEDGAYNRLLRLMWMTPGCSLPDDDAWIMRRMRVDAATFARVVLPVISEFLTRQGGRVFSARLTREWKKVDITSKLRSEAGKRGGRPKSVDNKEKEEKAGFDFDKARPKQPEPEPEEDKRDTDVSPKVVVKGTRLKADWQLPAEWSEWALSQGLSADVIQREGDKFRDYWLGAPGSKGVKLDWGATWRNWMRKRIEDAAPKSGSQSNFWTGNKVYT